MYTQHADTQTAQGAKHRFISEGCQEQKLVYMDWYAVQISYTFIPTGVFSCSFCYISQNLSQDHTHANMTAFDSQLRTQQSPSRQERRSGGEEDSLMIIAGPRPSS